MRCAQEIVSIPISYFLQEQQREGEGKCCSKGTTQAQLLPTAPQEFQARLLYGSTGRGRGGFYLLVNCNTCQTTPS